MITKKASSTFYAELGSYRATLTFRSMKISVCVAPKAEAIRFPGPPNMGILFAQSLYYIRL